MNARNADHARTWLRETDRLETGWSCGERPYHPLCSHDPGPHSPGCRHWCNLDCTDGIEAATRRARRVVRGRCILYADILRLFCAADDRPETRALPDRGALGFHQLYDRS